MESTDDIEPLNHFSIENKIPELMLIIDSYITLEQVGKIRVIKDHF